MERVKWCPTDGSIFRDRAVRSCESAWPGFVEITFRDGGALTVSAREYDSRVDRTRSRVVMLVTDACGPVARVTDRFGVVTVSVEGLADHPQTRRARARAAVREALGPRWNVTDYRGAAFNTHRNPSGELYGSMHHYGAVYVG